MVAVFLFVRHRSDFLSFTKAVLSGLREVLQVGLTSYLSVFVDQYVTVANVANRLSAITVEFTDPSKQPSPIDGSICFMGQECIFSARKVSSP